MSGTGEVIDVFLLGGKRMRGGGGVEQASERQTSLQGTRRPCPAVAGMQPGELALLHDMAPAARTHTHARTHPPSMRSDGVLVEWRLPRFHLDPRAKHRRRGSHGNAPVGQVDARDPFTNNGGCSGRRRRRSGRS